MGYFPMCVDLTGKTVFLVGNGPDILDKAEKLKPFSPAMVFLEDFGEADLQENPALVIVSNEDEVKAIRISRLCRDRKIPVNVIDRPELCSFFFPAMITKGDLTVSVSTGGKCPAGAACLKKRIASQLPDRSDEILLWLSQNRWELKRMRILSQAAGVAFNKNRPLTQEECRELSGDTVGGQG